MDYLVLTNSILHCAVVVRDGSHEYCMNGRKGKQCIVKQWQQMVGKNDHQKAKRKRIRGPQHPIWQSPLVSMVLSIRPQKKSACIRTIP